MAGKRRSPGRRPVIDAAAKVAMLAALREGRRLDLVAASYGVTLQAFYSARRRDPLFAAAWSDAHSLSAAAERGAGLHPPSGDSPGEDRIVSNNRRLLQRRKMRHVRFDEGRKGVFLAAFAESCDLLASAAAAGVCERTVYYHLKRDPVFAEAFQAALDEGYSRLNAETLRLRLEAQARLRSAMEAAEAAGEPLPIAEEGVEFDRAMKLLARWERRNGRLGRREVGLEHRRVWTFEQAIAELDRKLDVFGMRRGLVPPREGGEGDSGPGGSEVAAE